MSPVINHKPGTAKGKACKGMRVLVVAGSSAGHIFPACSFIDALRQLCCDVSVLLVLPRKNSAGSPDAEGYEVRYISTSSVLLKPSLKSIVSVFNFLKGSLESFFILLGFRPDIVVGFGGIPSVALLIWAWLFRIKTLIHEQNVIPGKATRFLAFFADSIALSFSETSGYFNKYNGKLHVTGNPVRSKLRPVDRIIAADYLGLDPGKFTILITGGSQGSSNLNKGFLRAIENLPDKARLQFIHLAGPKDKEFLEDGYARLNLTARVFNFLNDMHYAYSIADLLVARSGATTISEAAFFNIPAVFVPYPFAYQHQLANARILEKNGCAMIVNDSELNSGRLNTVLNDIISNTAKWQHMRSGYAAIPRIDSAGLLAKQVLSLTA